MCGRFTPIPRPQVLERFQKEFAIDVVEAGVQEAVSDVDLFGERQCLPYHDIDVLITDSKGRIVIGSMQWQLIHNWNRQFSSDYTNFNTRFEKLDRPHNRGLLCHSRCIVPVAEFFENRKVDGKTVKPRESFRFTVRGQSIVPLGGIYSIWTNPGDASDRRYSCSVITMEPNELVGEIHDRMPFIVPRDAIAMWLDRQQTDFEQVAAMIEPFRAELMARTRE